MSAKDIYEAKIYAANIYAAGIFRGIGAVATRTRYTQLMPYGLPGRVYGEFVHVVSVPKFPAAGTLELVGLLGTLTRESPIGTLVLAGMSGTMERGVS